MKKLYHFVLLFLLFTILIPRFVSSADVSTDITNQITNAQDKFESIPKTPEEIKAQYLKQEWNKLFASIPVIGKIHTFFLQHPLIFKILFNEPYSISLTFILIFILEIITAKIVYKPAKAQFNDSVAWTMAIGVPLIFAHISLYKIAVSKVLYLIFAQETFWFRALIWCGFFVLVIFLIALDEMLSKKIKQNKESQEKAELRQGIEESRTFIKTLKEYLGILNKSGK